MIRLHLIVPVMLLIQSSVFCGNLVKIGNKIITSEDFAKRKAVLNKVMPASGAFTDKYILDLIILYELAVMDAKSKGMDKSPEGQEVMENALFNYYMFKNVDEKVMNAQVNDSALRAQYAKYPYVTFKRLAMRFTEHNKESVRSKLSLYRSDINSGRISFNEAVKRLGAEDLSAINGVFQNVPSVSLPDIERGVLTRMRPGEVSVVLEIETILELIQLVKVHPYSEADTRLLAEAYKNEKVMQERQKFTEAIKAKYSNILQYYK